MLSGLFREGLTPENIIFVLSGIFVFISSISMHEFAHAYAADKLGDSTARYSGRLTLNPLAHIDPIGALMIIFVGFGWAKPVPVNSLNFKNQRKGMAITAFAGPLANFLIAIVFLLISNILAVAKVYNGNTGIYISLFFYYIIIRNIMLAVFNLIPVPPLDGSRILAAILPNKLYFAYMRYERYLYILLVVIMVSGVFSNQIWLLSSRIFEFFSWLTSLPFNLFL